jgi:hypothetical protein
MASSIFILLFKAPTGLLSSKGRIVVETWDQDQEYDDSLFLYKNNGRPGIISVQNYRDFSRQPFIIIKSEGVF